MTAVLQAKDVAKLVGLTEDGVKQWTIGRPYSIKPSIRTSPGKGVPNLYSVDDALRFYFAVELTADGFRSDVIQRALFLFGPEAAAGVARSPFKSKALSSRFRTKVLFISRVNGPEPELTFSGRPMYEMLRIESKKHKKKKAGDEVERSFYVMDVEALYEHLVERLAAVQGPKPEKAEEKKP